MTNNSTKSRKGYKSKFDSLGLVSEPGYDGSNSLWRFRNPPYEGQSARVDVGFICSPCSSARAKRVASCTLRCGRVPARPHPPRNAVAAVAVARRDCASRRAGGAHQENDCPLPPEVSLTPIISCSFLYDGSLTPGVRTARTPLAPPRQTRKRAWSRRRFSRPASRPRRTWSRPGSRTPERR